MQHAPPLHRRNALKIGGLGLFGVAGLPGLLRLAAEAAPSGQGGSVNDTPLQIVFPRCLGA